MNINDKKPSREEILEIFEAMAVIQTLPQHERTALTYYIKGVIAAISGQLPIPVPQAAAPSTKAI